MRKMVSKYRVSKFKRFTNGLLFAVISVISLLLCLSGMYGQAVVNEEILLPFTIAIISMLLGFVSMFRAERNKIELK